MINYATKASIAATVFLLLAGCGQNSDNEGESASAAAMEAEVAMTPVTTSKIVASLTLANPVDVERRDAVLRISHEELGVEPGSAAGLGVRDEDGPVPSQHIDDDGDGRADTLLLLADYQPAEVRSFEVVEGSDPGNVVKRTQAEISIKQGGEWQEREYIGGEFVNVTEMTTPDSHTDHSWYIRYEGPGIESDLVGYRVYLDWRNGFDIFGKKTDAMVLQDVGQDGFDSYHEMADWGMDVLKVGDAVGAGGYGYWDGEQVIRVEETGPRSVRILDNGPLYSQFEILYEDWAVGGQVLDLSARLAMTAGSRLVHTRLHLSEPLDNVVAGMVKHPGTKLLQGELEISGHAWTWVASWGKQSLNDDHLGMMLLFRKGDREQQTEDEHNYVSILRPRDGHVEYYFGAVWEGEKDGINTEEAFIELLEEQAERLTIPLRSQLSTAHTKSQVSSPIEPQSALEWSERLADSEMKRNGVRLAHGGFDQVSQREAAWRYTTGLLSQAADDVAQETGNSALADWARMNIESYIEDDGSIRTYRADEYNIDKINSGKMLLRLYQQSGDEKFLNAAGHLRAQMADHPRTSEGAFWHKQRYPGQLWLDGVYMGMPFLAHYAEITGDEEALEEAVNEFLVSRKHLRDETTGLYFHAWDENKQQIWANPETGLSPHFWSRGMGWYAMALVDVLDFIPAERSDLREPLIDIIAEMAAALLEYRASDGAWYQITDLPDEAGNYLEASGSSMFVYMLAKAVNKGYLPEEYRGITAAAFSDLVRRFINVNADDSVSLRNICAVAGLGFGRDGSYRYYMSEPVISNDPKGTGPFIMAGVQVSRMLSDMSDVTVGGPG